MKVGSILLFAPLALCHDECVGFCSAYTNRPTLCEQTTKCIDSLCLNLFWNKSTGTVDISSTPLPLPLTCIEARHRLAYRKFKRPRAPPEDRPPRGIPAGKEDYIKLGSLHGLVPQLVIKRAGFLSNGYIVNVDTGCDTVILESHDSVHGIASRGYVVDPRVVRADENTFWSEEFLIGKNTRFITDVFTVAMHTFDGIEEGILGVNRHSAFVATFRIFAIIPHAGDFWLDLGEAEWGVPSFKYMAALADDSGSWRVGKRIISISATPGTPAVSVVVSLVFESTETFLFLPPVLFDLLMSLVQAETTISGLMRVSACKHVNNWPKITMDFRNGAIVQIGERDYVDFSTCTLKVSKSEETRVPLSALVLSKLAVQYDNPSERIGIFVL